MLAVAVTLDHCVPALLLVLLDITFYCGVLPRMALGLLALVLWQ